MMQVSIDTDRLQLLGHCRFCLDRWSSWNGGTRRCQL